MEGGDQGQHIQIKLTFYSITVGSTTLVISIFFLFQKDFFSKSMYQVCRCRRYEYGMQNRSGRLWVVWLDLEGKKNPLPEYLWSDFKNILHLKVFQTPVSLHNYKNLAWIRIRYFHSDPDPDT